MTEIKDRITEVHKIRLGDTINWRYVNYYAVYRKPKDLFARGYRQPQ